jgi:hypothetical protein
MHAETYIADGAWCGTGGEITSTDQQCRGLSVGWRAAEALVALLFSIDYVLQVCTLIYCHCIHYTATRLPLGCH